MLLLGGGCVDASCSLESVGWMSCEGASWVGESILRELKWGSCGDESVAAGLDVKGAAPLLNGFSVSARVCKTAMGEGTSQVENEQNSPQWYDHHEVGQVQ